MPAYSEFYSEDGAVRPHHRELVEYLKAHPYKDSEQLRRLVRARLLEQEVSYNALGAPGGSERAWALDEIPHLIPADEFTELSERLASRAELLSATLDDFYGAQRLLRERVIPPEVVLANPRYFRPLHGVKPLGDKRLLLYAADTVKAPDGTYVVHADRTAAPSGAGYALENRLAIGQIHAAPFRGYRIRKVNRFFETMNEALRLIAVRREGVPRIVLLTPGQHDESSFEHGYLARYQGIELVEGRDLTVRGNEVFFKTLEGLRRVDMIVRRVSDDWCDPLELRDDSLLGVSGLVGAVRAGNVGIANPLGSGIIECAVFRAYLADISRALHGRDLAIDSIPTRHLGHPRHREEVLDTWGDWTIRPAFYDRRGNEVQNDELDVAASAELLKRTLFRPDAFVAERSPTPSTVPVGMDLKRKGELSMRLFACWSAEGYTVMPGGLGRVDAAPDGLFQQGRDGATTKDVWIIGGKDAVEPAPPKMPEAPLQIRRGGIDLPSRLFDDIFWLGRYAERSDGSGRLIRVGLEPMIRESTEFSKDFSDALLTAMASLQLISSTTAKHDTLEGALLAAYNDTTRPSSVRSGLERLRGLTVSARSRLSSDGWATLRRLSAVNESQRGAGPDETLLAIDEVLLHLAAFRGLVASNMVRGHGWVFLEMGRRIERGVFVLTLISHLFSGGGSRLLMETLLRICDSLLTYRSRYLSSLQATPVVDLVLTDSTNPQSVLFQVQRLLWCVRELPKDSPFPLSRAEQRLIRLEASLVTADLASASRGDASGLREMAEEGINLLWQVSDDISRTYFTHAQASRSMSHYLAFDTAMGGDG